MKWKESVKIIGIAFITSFSLYAIAGGGNATPWIFLFYFIIIFYLTTDTFRGLLDEDDSKTIVNKNFHWLITASGCLAIVHILTGVTVSYFVDYCD